MQSKEFWLSKAFWVNIVAIIIFVIQYFLKDLIVPFEIQGAILAIINLILRILTKKEIIWNKQKK